MKKGICIKCGSRDLYTHKFYESGRGVLRITYLKTLPVNEYVCGTCGYLESYVEDAHSLEFIRTKCEKLSVKK